MTCDILEYYLHGKKLQNVVSLLITKVRRQKKQRQNRAEQNMLFITVDLLRAGFEL